MRCPNVRVECTDYTDAAIDELRRVNTLIECAYVFDMLQGDYALLEKYDAVLFVRLETEFTMQELESIFSKMRAAGVKRIIFVPSILVNRKYIICEYIKFFVRGLFWKKRVFAGWFYSKTELSDILQRQGYKISLQMPFRWTTIWVLEAVD